MNDTAFIALGSNLGNPLAQLRAAGRALETLGEVAARSSLYQTAPVGGPPGQPAYLNAVVSLKPKEIYQEPERLLEALLVLEQRQGRERLERWGPRTLDLDVLAFGDKIIHNPTLTLPHPRMWERAFVLEPLCEIRPDFRHPTTGETVCEVLACLDRTGVCRLQNTW